MTRDLKLSVWIGLGVTALLMLAVLPMALRLVPMNRHYGLRVPAAYVSEQQWLLMNQVCGIGMLATGLATLIVGFWLLRRYRSGSLGWTEKQMALALGLMPVLSGLLAIALPFAFIP